jgi:hypothetical protein
MPRLPCPPDRVQALRKVLAPAAAQRRAAA